MVRNLLIRVESDPRESARPAEAVRIGAGVGAWNKVKVHFVFVGPAVMCLDEFADELKEGELFAQYLPSIAQHGGRIVVDESSATLKGIQPTSALQFEKLSSAAIEQLQHEADHVMRF